MRPDAVILVFWMLSFKPAFLHSSFTYIKRLFGSSLLSAIRVASGEVERGNACSPEVGRGLIPLYHRCVPVFVFAMDRDHFFSSGAQDWINWSLYQYMSRCHPWCAFVWLLVCSLAYYDIINTREPATLSWDLNHNPHFSYTSLNPPNLIAINRNPPYFISLPFFPLDKVFSFLHLHVFLKSWFFKNFIKREHSDFPGGPLVLPSNTGGVCLWSRVRELRVPHALGPKNQNVKQKQCCNKFNNDFKKWSTSTNTKKKKEMGM